MVSSRGAPLSQMVKIHLLKLWSLSELGILRLPSLEVVRKIVSVFVTLRPYNMVSVCCDPQYKMVGSIFPWCPTVSFYCSFCHYGCSGPNHLLSRVVNDSALAFPIMKLCGLPSSFLSGQPVWKWEIITPQPKGSWVLLASRECWCCPRAVERLVEARVQHQHSQGANNTHEPEGWGVMITFL